MKVAITGATGFVGTRLVEKLQEQEYDIIVLTSNLARATQIFPTSAFPRVKIVSYLPKEYRGTEIAQCQAVVNLAGQPIADRWTEQYKQEILSSRQLVTSNLVKSIGEANPKPQVLINASAIGYYGTSETASFNESSPPGDDFLAQVCQTWETEAKKVQEFGVRLVILRIGIVLGNGGGALAKMISPFKMFAGGPIGTGRQWFSWIHRDDLVNLIITGIERSELNGTYNATAPHPVRMQEFCRTLGEVMGRPSWLPVPGVALELLLGEGAKLVLEGQQVLPKETQAIAFTYQYPHLKEALTEILK
ncbi:TIGR01777 family oxidoreductase [Gloeocapsa sp. PCC 73106]|uniref:thylakoid membrane protein ThyD n=1 Tax=Gloeocapsa sp. PCC 73106 TaxID=102232 RepID=UPI0002AC31E4|nr:TIGR01777 family oxidoreductase [Gloeocapsa sp. PCC 73106]ELR97923.1 TIGR01777 family protein [Gloeocapsa sp. PCC 73106]